MERRTYFVTAAAGVWIAGRRVDMLEPGPSGVVELELTPAEAGEDLRIGALSSDPPEKSRQEAEERPPTSPERQPAPKPRRRRLRPA